MSFRLTKGKVRLAGAILALCGSTVVYHEGTGISKDGVARSYLDSAGVWTICSGDTKDVSRGQTATKQECSERLQNAVQEHAQVLTAVPTDVPDYVVLGSVDFAYHVGVYGAKESTAIKYLQEHDYERAGKALLMWRYITNDAMAGKSGWRKMSGHWKYDCSTAGNRVCSGIWKRRLWEADTISGKLGTAAEAEAALPRYDAMYASKGKWVIPPK